MRGLTINQLRSKCWRLRFFALAAILMVTSGAWLGTRRGEAATLLGLIRAGRLPAQLSDVPSHNRRYRASLLPLKGAEWELRLESSAREPLSGASLVMQAWMPEEPSADSSRPEIIADGHGVYRVNGLRLDRPGWWNMKLTVRQSGITDSLAFNLIIP